MQGVRWHHDDSRKIHVVDVDDHCARVSTDPQSRLLPYTRASDDGIQSAVVGLDFPRVAFPSKFLQNYLRERRLRRAVYRSFRAGAIGKRYANNSSGNSVTSDNFTAICAVTTDRNFVCHFGHTCY